MFTKYIENRKVLRFLRISVGNICLLLEHPWRELCASVVGEEMETDWETTV